MKLLRWLWGLLPDRCEGIYCIRAGVRGNENVIDGRVICDYCSSRHMGGLCVIIPSRPVDAMPGRYHCLTHAAAHRDDGRGER